MDIDFIESKENLELAEKLQEKYFQFIGNVDLRRVYFAEMIGFKPKKAPVFNMSGITQAWARNILSTTDQKKDYCLAVWSDEWAEVETSKKEWIIFRSLFSVSPFGDGKLRPFDVQDYGFIVEYFVRIGLGPYWLEKENLPSLLSGNDTLPLILPLEDDEE